MANESVVELNAYQTMAYWWVKRIKTITDEIKEHKEDFDPRKQQFAEIFDVENIGGRGYRKLYVFLTKKIKERCEGKRRFTQRTLINNKGHEELTKWLSEIMETEVPNINLATDNKTDTQIYITQEKGQKPMTFVGETSYYGIIRQLPTKYKANAILCGPKKKAETKEDEVPSQN